jgi:hypothetical protein
MRPNPRPDRCFTARFGALGDVGAAAAQLKRGLAAYQNIAVQAYCLHLEGKLRALWHCRLKKRELPYLLVNLV